MPSSGMLRSVALVRTDVSQELARLLVTANTPSSPILIILMVEELRSSEKFGSYKSHTA
jgi:hypothetical protein